MNQNLKFLCFWGTHNSLPSFWANFGYSRIKIDHFADSLLKLQVKFEMHFISRCWTSATPYSEFGFRYVLRYHACTDTQLCQTSKTCQKLDWKTREFDGSYLCLQWFDKFWLWSASKTEANLNMQKLAWKNSWNHIKLTYFWRVVAIWNHGATGRKPRGAVAMVFLRRNYTQYTRRYANRATLTQLGSRRI